MLYMLNYSEKKEFMSIFAMSYLAELRFVLHRVLNFARFYTWQSQKGGAWSSSIHVGGLGHMQRVSDTWVGSPSMRDRKILRDVFGNWETILR